MVASRNKGDNEVAGRPVSDKPARVTGHHRSAGAMERVQTAAVIVKDLAVEDIADGWIGGGHVRGQTVGVVVGDQEASRRHDRNQEPGDSSRVGDSDEDDED